MHIDPDTFEDIKHTWAVITFMLGVVIEITIIVGFVTKVYKAIKNKKVGSL